MKGKESLPEPREVHIDFRATEEERDILREYCRRTKRNQSDVLREFIRTLARKKA